MTLGTILLIILVLLLIGAFPAGAGYNRNWGYRPSGIIGFLIIVVIVLALLRVIPF